MTAPGYPVKYTGPDVQCANFVVRPRRPLTSDYRQPENAKLYRLSTVWQVGKNPSTGVEGELWMLSKIVANIATWVMLSGGSGIGTVVSLTGDDGVEVDPDGAGNIDVFGNIVGNGTHAKPLFVQNSAANTEQWDLQLATTVAPTPVNPNSAGIASFNNTQFSIDPTSGMVTFTGGGSGTVITLTGDDAVAVNPDGLGNLNIVGNVVANGTHAKPVYVINSVANTETIDVQLAKAVVATPANSNSAGIACFNDSQFTVDATSGMVSVLGSGTDYHVARYIVSPGGAADGANYTTIGTAYAAAVLAAAPQTVFIQPGTYTENLTLTAGINLAAFTSDATSSTSAVTIVGKLSYSGSGNVSIGGIQLRTNADYCISVTGSTNSVLRLENCFIYAFNNNAIQFTSSSGASKIEGFFCRGDVAATYAFFTQSGSGKLAFYNSYFENNGGTTTAATCISGAFGVLNSYWNCPVTISGTGSINLNQVEFHGPLIANGSGASQSISGCSVAGGTSSAISIGAGASLSVYNSSISSTNTNAISGAGTLNYADLSFSNTSSLMNTTTQVQLTATNPAIKVRSPAAYPYTVIPQDALVIVSTAAARTINLPAAPSSGEQHYIKDNTGSGAANNITVQGNGHNIDGAASKTINTNFGVFQFIYNGTQWNVV